jgi:hypothetical protein
MFFVMGFVPFLYYSLLGRLWSRTAAHALFYLPSTAPPTAALQRCVDAQCDGLPTWSHFLRPMPSFLALSLTTRVLVLGAERDVVYAPEPLVPAWRTRFPQCTIHIAPQQAHCLSCPILSAKFSSTIVQFLC